MGKKVTVGTHMPHVKGLVTIHKNRVGHVDIKLESIGLDFSLIKIKFVAEKSVKQRLVGSLINRV